MKAFRTQVKIFARSAVPVEPYVPVFHRWIREHVLPDLLLDVVDYSHVADGPSVVLIGHAVDYALDSGGGELGLLHARKREAPPEGERVSDALRRAVHACLLLEREPGVEKSLGFRSDELLIRIADRLAAPNDDSTLQEVLPSLTQALEPAYGKASLELSRVGTPREMFSVRIKAKSAPSLGQLLERLGGPPA